MGFSVVTTNLGLASPLVHSALPTTRRRRDQVSSVEYEKSLNRRAGLPVLPRFRLGLGQFGADLADQPRIARQTEQKVDAVGLAPAHQLLAAEAGIAAQQNAHARPARPNLRDDPGDLLASPRRLPSMLEGLSLAASKCRPQNT